MIRERSSKLTTEISATIINAIRRGNYMITAATLAGVSEKTAYNWLDRGEVALERTPEGSEIPESDVVFVAFALGVHRAAAEVEDESVNALRTGKMLVETASGARSQITDRKGHLKFLERRYPDRWGNRKAIEHTGSLELNHHAKVVMMPPLETDETGNTVETKPGTTNQVPVK